MRKNSVTLSVAHNIFLTKKQRYSLNKGDRLVVVGTSLPVWFYKGATSEPAEEVFCKYILVNEKGKKSSVVRTKLGYKINIPQLPNDYKLPELTDEAWRAMNEQQRTEWYLENQKPIGSWKLLDYIDGGGKSLSFKIIESKNLAKKSNNELLKAANVVHIVLIKDIEELESSITCNL